MENFKNKTFKTADERAAERLVAYKNAKNDIANLLGWFECELEKETNTGSPVDALRELIRALALFSGISEKQIKESLEDLNEGTSK